MNMTIAGTESTTVKMKCKFTAVFLAALVGIVLCDDKMPKTFQNIKHYVKSNPKTWKYQGWNATLRGPLKLALTSHYRIPYNKDIGFNAESTSDCGELKKMNPTLDSGVYTIKPGKVKYQVYCDMKTQGGGWTVFQRRFNGSVDFYRSWADYKKGFGEAGGEYWLGNEALHELTSKGGYSLRIELTSLADKQAYAEYKTFSIGSESEEYKLFLTGYSGTAGDSLAIHNGMKFTTKDRDNDTHGSNCAVLFKGAWWYKQCVRSNLNGLFPDKNKSKNWSGTSWYDFQKKHTTNFKQVKMMIKRSK